MFQHHQTFSLWTSDPTWRRSNVWVHAHAFQSLFFLSLDTRPTWSHILFWNNIEVPIVSVDRDPICQYTRWNIAPTVLLFLPVVLIRQTYRVLHVPGAPHSLLWKYGVSTETEPRVRVRCVWINRHHDKLTWKLRTCTLPGSSVYRFCSYMHMNCVGVSKLPAARNGMLPPVISYTTTRRPSIIANASCQHGQRTVQRPRT